MEDLIIEKMKIEDLEEIEESLLEDFDDFWSVNILKSELEKDNSLYLLIKKEDEIIGFAGININFDYVELMNIVVKKEYRKRGVGKKLLNKIIEETKNLKKSAIYLEVNEENYDAINLYKTSGFEEVGKRKKYYEGKYDAVLMKMAIL